MKRLLVMAAIGLVAAGCGGGENTGVEQTPVTTTAPPPTTTAAAGTTTAAEAMSLELFFLAPDGQLVAASRQVDHTQAPAGAALRELTTPATGTTTEVPGDLQVTIDGGRAQVTGATLDEAALAQVVYSLTSFPTVQSVN